MKFTAGLVVFLALFALNASLLMLLIGVWHGMRPAVPAVGFGEACVILGVAALFAPQHRPSRD